MASLFPPPSPGLPPFRTLLVQGPFHPSAPVHLMLSQNAQNPKGKALMITPSRQTLAAALVECDDEWLKIHGGHGQTCSASSRVDILYPPTQAHLALLLAMLHVYEGSFHHPKTTLPTVPSLFVLHEISTFCSTGANEPTLSTYLSLISRALTVVNSLSAQSTSPVALAVFDSKLHDLKLPVLRPVSPAQDETGTPSSSRRRESVAMFAEKYFEWIGTVEALTQDEIPSSQPDETNIEPKGGRMRMTLRRGRDSAADVVWEWVVCTRMAGPYAGGKYFDWT